MAVVKKMKVLFVDDEENILKSIKRNIFSYSETIEPYFVTSGADALEITKKTDFDLIITDAKMPSMNGGELLKKLQENPKTKEIPTIMLTGYAEDDIRKEALEAGIVEFLNKPIIAEEFILRIRNVLRLKKISDDLREMNAELYKTRLQIIRRLGKAAEYKDNETGKHVIRVAHYSQILAEGLKLPQEIIELIFQTAPMHDIGKIGVADEILKKPGKLSPEEFEVIKHHSVDGKEILSPMSSEELEQYVIHTTIGEDILGEDDTPLLKMAGAIAATHHERWDGKGYPRGIKGEAIPIEGRIVAVADIFDALSSKRYYKPAFPPEECKRMINEMSGQNLDPQLVEIFNENFEAFMEIRDKYGEE